ncbi:MAG: hypothetical protein JJE52_01800 [Acidimicrobiia bacterium]|nr:hypothetical protein [Acidimicrobiia bacterium]
MTRDRARVAIDMAQSDAEVERSEAIAWLLGHPDDARPLLVEVVRTGTATSPEIVMRTLAAVGGEEAVAAIKAALLRGHPGEAFYAAVALAESGASGHEVLRRHADHPVEAVRTAVAHATSIGPEDRR